MIELGFYDIATNRFLEDRVIISKIKVNLKIYQARLLGISDINVEFRKFSINLSSLIIENLFLLERVSLRSSRPMALILPSYHSSTRLHMLAHFTFPASSLGRVVSGF
jgi:hypothetical protein